jgi:putative transcription factor
MKAACEICGSPLRASPNRVEIDGAIMVVCNNCARLGRQIGPSPQARERPPMVQGPPRSYAPRPPSNPVPQYEVDPDYNLKIRQAREKLGLSQEQLGMMLNEKPSVIKMVESKKLLPDENLTRKLMHQLKINLLVSLSELEGGRPTGV